MDYREFKHDDITELNKWLEARGIKSVCGHELPYLGCVVFQGSQNVAMGFLRQAEGLGIIDSMITNPEASPAARNEAMDLLFKQLIIVCSDFDLEHLIGFTVDDSMVKRSEKFGFKQSPHKLMTLTIG